MDAGNVLFLIIFCGVWGFIGIVFLSVGFGLSKSRKTKEINCTSLTTGKVVGIEARTSRSMNSGSSKSYHPVFEYSLDAYTITKESIFGTNPCKFYVGQQVTVHYNPSDLNEYFVEEEKLGKSLGIIFSSIGSVCLFVAVITVFFSVIF